MFNLDICADCALKVVSFLTKKDIMNYDTAMTNKESREMFLKTVKHLTIGAICRWTFLRGIGNVTEQCVSSNLQYVSGMCKQLVIYADRLTSQTEIINVYNNNITHLHMDLYNNREATVSNISGNKITNITLVYVEDIDSRVFINLSRTCPNLQKITLFFHYLYTTDLIKGYVNNSKIKVNLFF